jgi:hypothetical protein
MQQMSYTRSRKELKGVPTTILGTKSIARYISRPAAGVFENLWVDTLYDPWGTKATSDENARRNTVATNHNFGNFRI